MPSSLVSPLNAEAPISSLPDFIYGRLHLEILNGSLRPGEFLRQEELAKRFGVSRVPIREALNRLEGEGLIVLWPRRGYAVMSLDPDEITEIFELRTVIEEHAGIVAAAVRTKDDIREVAGILEKMARLNKKAPDYFLKWSQLNREFHGRLIASGRRKRVTRIASLLRDAVEPYIRVEARMTGHVDDADAEHRAMFRAFKAGNGRRLGKLSAKHCENTASRLLGKLRSKAEAAAK